HALEPVAGVEAGVEGRLGAQADAGVAQALEPGAQERGDVASPTCRGSGRPAGQAAERLPGAAHVGGERPHRRDADELAVLERAQDVGRVALQEAPVLVVARVAVREPPDRHGRVEVVLLYEPDRAAAHPSSSNGRWMARSTAVRSTIVVSVRSTPSSMKMRSSRSSRAAVDRALTLAMNE